MRTLYFMLALGSLYTPVAHAGEVEKAEHTRLSEEMRKLAQRNAWSAVEANYVRLEELEKKGEVISAKEHMLGAESARANGDMTACRSRLDRAVKLEPSKDGVEWIADLDRRYGSVKIHIDSKFTGDRTIVPAVPPFAPDERQSIVLAAAAVSESRAYEGLLPAGDYSVAGQNVTVAAGAERVAKLNVGPPPDAPKEPFKLAYVGPRLELGVAFTSAGELNEAGSGADAGLQAASFGGPGARVGVGLEIGLSPNFGVIAEVGYHNLFGSPTADGEKLEDNEQYVVAGNSMHMGFGWLAASIRAGNLWFAVGPLWGAGTGTVTGVAGFCVDGGTCEEFAAPGGESARYQRVTGDITAGGGAASLSYALMDLGKLKGALTLGGGAQTDSFRLYPWGEVAFTVAPASRRAE